MMKLLLPLSAPVLWFAHFSATYGMASVCGPPSSLINAEQFQSLIVGLNVVALAGLATIALAQFRSQRMGDPFLGRVGLGLTALSTVALAWVNLPLLLVSACGN